MLSRQQIRAEILSQRKKLTAQFCKNAASIVCEKIIQSDFFLASHNIAFYLPINNELDPTLILQHAWQLNKNCYLPAVNHVTQNNLLFLKYQKNEQLILNKFKILEPILTKDKIIAADKLDLVIVPLVAFDNSFNRLGTGAGFYDRTFAFKRESKNFIKPFLCGIGYDLQNVTIHHKTLLKPNEFDVKLDLVITEK